MYWSGCDRRKDHGLRPIIGHGCDRRKDHEMSLGWHVSDLRVITFGKPVRGTFITRAWSRHVDILLHGYELVNYHDIVCHYVYACCELPSTFNVLTWLVMPVFRKVPLERSAV